MRKKNLILLLVVGTLMGAMLTGCGQSSETIENDMTVETTEAPSKEEGIGMVEQMTGGDKETPDKSEAPTEAPTEVPTEAPTEAPTPEPTEAPQMTDWFEENGYKVSEAGDFTYTGWSTESFADGSSVKRVWEITGNCEYSEVDNGDGTKTITAKIAQNPCTTEAGSYSVAKGTSFVADRYTGTVYTVSDFNLTESFVVTLEDDREITITVYQEKIKATKFSDEQTIETFTMTVPADYDGLVCGWAPTKGFEAYGKTVTFADFPIFEGAEIFMWAN